MTLERIQELAANTPAGLVVFHEQNLGLSHPARVNRGALFAALGLCKYRSGDLHRRLNVWNIVNVATVHGVNAI